MHRAARRDQNRKARNAAAALCNQDHRTKSERGYDAVERFSVQPGSIISILQKGGK